MGLLMDEGFCGPRVLEAGGYFEVGLLWGMNVLGGLFWLVVSLS